MIAFLSGKVGHVNTSSFILNVNGVGYFLFATSGLMSQVSSGVNIDVYVYTIVREQEISLYSFSSYEERTFFELLISVSGIGPKSALEFFALPIESIKNAIVTGDTAFLSQVKGIGKKTAERLVVELKSKTGEISSLQIIDATAKEEADGESTVVLEALKSLGYESTEIVKKLKNAPKFETAEEAVEWYLKN